MVKKILRATTFKWFVMVGVAIWLGAHQALALALETNNVQTAITNRETTSSLKTSASAISQKNVTPTWIIKLSKSLPFLKYQIFGNELWKYILSLIYIFLAFLLAKGADLLFRRVLKHLAEKTTTELDDLIIETLRNPIKIVFFVIFLRIGLDVFEWPEIIQTILSKAFTIIVAATITYAIIKVLDLFFGYWRSRNKEDKNINEQLIPLIRKSLQVFIIIVASLVTLTNLGIDVTAAIASLSIGGLAIGLAAQDTLANIFGAAAIFIDKPFKIGDRIKINDIDGFVESISLRSTRIRNLDGHLITVPNKMMGNSIITNITRRPNIRTVMTIGITYNTPAEKIKRATQILEEIYRSHPKTHDVIIGFNQFADFSLNITVIHWWNSTDYKDYLQGMQELNLKIKERFDQEGIEFAFPTRTVYLRYDQQTPKNVEPTISKTL